jgi:hypothetical protein
MTTFVHCRGCGTQIHESAPACPKCGAPQPVTTSSTATASMPVVVTGVYGAVPWFRRRWFLILCILSIAPIAAVVALTGEIFYSAKGAVKPFQKNIKTTIYILSLYYVYTLFTPVGSSQQGICFLISAVLAVVMGLKK